MAMISQPGSPVVAGNRHADEHSAGHHAESGRLGRRQPSAAPRDRRPRRSARPGRHRKIGTGRLV